MEINDLTSATYYTLINFYSGAGNKEKLKSWIERYLENIKKNNPVYAYTDMQSAVTLISAGFTKPGTAILESYAVELVNNYLNYSSLDYYISRIDLENLLIYMKNIGENNSVKISVIDELLKKIEK
jgi:Txe/YoeB family toxin of Txe-Axe toxin-antitoxin module